MREVAKHLLDCRLHSIERVVMCDVEISPVAISTKCVVKFADVSGGKENAALDSHCMHISRWILDIEP